MLYVKIFPCHLQSEESVLQVIASEGEAVTTNELRITVKAVTYQTRA